MRCVSEVSVAGLDAYREARRRVEAPEIPEEEMTWPGAGRGTRKSAARCAREADRCVSEVSVDDRRKRAMKYGRKCRK